MGLENIKRDGFVLADSNSLFDWARTDNNDSGQKRR